MTFTLRKRKITRNLYLVKDQCQNQIQSSNLNLKCLRSRYFYFQCPTHTIFFAQSCAQIPSHPNWKNHFLTCNNVLERVILPETPLHLPIYCNLKLNFQASIFTWFFYTDFRFEYYQITNQLSILLSNIRTQLESLNPPKIVLVDRRTDFFCWKLR